MGQRSRARIAAGEQAAPVEASTATPAVRGGARRRRKRVPWSQRERIGHEEPGSVLRGPPIAVTCECGEKKDLRYGDRWTCEACGRVYDTATIPREQYDAIRTLQLRYRLVPIALGTVTLALAIFFTLSGNIFGVFILLPSVILVWFTLIRPPHRRSFQKAIAGLPTWDLRAE